MNAELARPLVFGEDARTYDRVRPEYPSDAIEHVVTLVDTRRALEVGAGTGKATTAVARAGLQLVCLEPSPAMAEVLEAKRLPGVSVERTTFESWPPGETRFDLVFAAQSWHWVDRETGYAKAAAMLRPGGAFALIWNLPVRRHHGFEEVYARWAPHILAEQDDRVKRRDSHDWLADMADAGFDHLEKRSWSWSTVMTAEAYRDLCSTYSDHMMIPIETRRSLLDALAEAVSERGGTVTQDYTTEVFSGGVPVTVQG